MFHFPESPQDTPLLKIISCITLNCFSVPTSYTVDSSGLAVFKGKGKEEYLYSAFVQRLVSKRSDIDHTVLPANYTMPAFRSISHTD